MRNLILIITVIGVIAFLSGCPSNGDSGTDEYGAQTSSTGGGGIQSTGGGTIPPEDVNAAGEKPSSDNQLIVGAGSDTNTKCVSCGMNAGVSPSEVVFEDKRFDGLSCWTSFVDENKSDFTGATMLDYSTFEGTKAYIPLRSAFFVEVKSLRMTMPPFIAAFATEDAAKAFAEKESSEVMPIEALVNRMKTWSMENSTSEAKGETACTTGDDKSDGCGGKSCGDGKKKKDAGKETTT